MGKDPLRGKHTWLQCYSMGLKKLKELKKNILKQQTQEYSSNSLYLLYISLLKKALKLLGGRGLLFVMFCLGWGVEEMPKIFTRRKSLRCVKE